MKNHKLPKTPVNVTHSMLPPLENYFESVRDIFSSGWLTNQGRYASRLEQSLTSFLHVQSLSLCANGTLALQIAIRLLGLNGKKIITTPFSYVATLSALLWEGCTPIFADINANTLCIDPDSIRQCLEKEPDIAGILPVHVYGNACDVEQIGNIAKEYNLPVLYDAAHVFGSKLNGISLYNFGNVSTGSFHATKLFHTVEGGCIITPSIKDKEKISLLRAFGHTGDIYKCLGLNAKMSELHAAMGLCLLPKIDDAITHRIYLTRLYDEALGIGKNSQLRHPTLAKGLEWNHAYYPVIFPNNETMIRCKVELEKNNIQPRRYFYPSLNKLPYVKYKPCPISEDIVQRVLCLPFWSDMDEKLINNIAVIIRE